MFEYLNTYSISPHCPRLVCQALNKGFGIFSHLKTLQVLKAIAS